MHSSGYIYIWNGNRGIFVTKVQFQSDLCDGKFDSGWQKLDSIVCIAARSSSRGTIISILYEDRYFIKLMNLRMGNKIYDHRLLNNLGKQLY